MVRAGSSYPRARVSNSIFHRHPRLTLLCVTAVLCTGLLFAVEALLARNAPSAGVSSHRSIRLREHKPGHEEWIDMPAELLRDPDSLTTERVHLAVDENGFIEPSVVHDDPELSVVFLGGSTTECLWVQEENRFPYVVGRLLEQGPRYSRVNSINAGRSANHSLHSIAALIGKVVPLRPQVCVLLHNCNDLMVLLQHETYWSTRIAYRNMLEHRRRQETVGTRTKDLVRQMFPNVLELFSPTMVADDLAALRGRQANVDRAFIESHFKSSLTTFVEICRAWGIRPVLMTQANRITEQPDAQFGHLPERLRLDFGVEYSEYHELYHWMNALIRDVGRAEDVAVVDLASLIPQTKEFVYDPYHLNDAGSRKAAEHIAAALVTMLAE